MKGQGDIFFQRDGSLPKTTFSKAFPDIENLTADVTEKGLGNEGLGVRRFTKTSYREFINCSNVLCSGHGAPTGNILRSLVENHRTTYKEDVACTGREESGKPCTNIFSIEITLKYRAL
jgi:hypothetical protein